MKPAKLTRAGGAATRPTEREALLRRLGSKGTKAAMLAGTLALGGCINVNAPTEPIVIELNINIRQEVIYRLAEDAGNTIEENADIF